MLLLEALTWTSQTLTGVFFPEREAIRTSIQILESDSMPTRLCRELEPLEEPYRPDAPETHALQASGWADFARCGP